MLRQRIQPLIPGAIFFLSLLAEAQTSPPVPAPPVSPAANACDLPLLSRTNPVTRMELIKMVLREGIPYNDVVIDVFNKKGETARASIRIFGTKIAPFGGGITDYYAILENPWTRELTSELIPLRTIAYLNPLRAPEGARIYVDERQVTASSDGEISFGPSRDKEDTSILKRQNPPKRRVPKHTPVDPKRYKTNYLLVLRTNNQGMKMHMPVELLSKTNSPHGEIYEIRIYDDGSIITDTVTERELRSWRPVSNDDAAVKILEFKRSYGITD